MPGTSMHKNLRPYYGVGINDSDYAIESVANGKRHVCPFFRKWHRMLERAYCHKYHYRKPSYTGVSVCNEWHSFMAFRYWMLTQNWEGKHLDKDLIFPGNKVYSPETCAFVDGITNNFTTDYASGRGEWPIGVNFDKANNKFKARICNPFTKKSESLGYFSCPDKAHFAWKRRKHELALQLADIQSDPRVAEALRSRYAITPTLRG